ncbi:MAG: 2-phosphosulfolactate phosphatase [Wenzhouxiangella sp.]|nr:2-phosphosulfolactate phosphatase [Wenzhouxiangella sp.]
MEVRIQDRLNEPTRLPGAVVVIDVWRACTSLCCLLERGVASVFLARTADEAKAERARQPDALLLGEYRGRQLADFDLGNSPAEIMKASLRGRTIVMTTSNCTRGVHHALDADLLLCAGFVNAAATVRYLQRLAPERVTLVAMGNLESSCPADLACAEFLASALGGTDGRDFAALRTHLLATPEAQKFYDDARIEFSREDLEWSLHLDALPFVLEIERGDRLPVVHE